MILYIDIETIPGAEANPEDVKVPANYKDPEKIKAYQQANVEKETRSYSLKSTKARILCLGFAIADNTPNILSGTEEGILNGFSELLKDDPTIVGHNILGFDLKFLQHRLIKFGLPTMNPGKFRMNSYGVKDPRYFDTMKEWGFLDYKDMTKLSDIAEYLGIGQKEGMEGSEVYDYYKRGQLQEIYDYCKGDVNLTREVYKRMVQ